MSDESNSNTEISQLLIIGNGFDLHGGLHSDFSHFIQRVYPNIIKDVKKCYKLKSSTILDNTYKFLTDKINTSFSNLNFNYWTQCLLLLKLYLKHHKTLRNINWCDIENCLTEAIKSSPSKDEYTRYFFYINNIMHNLQQLIIYCTSRKIIDSTKDSEIISQANKKSQEVCKSVYTNRLSLFLIYKLLKNEDMLIRYGIVDKKDSITHYVISLIDSYDDCKDLMEFLAYDDGEGMYDKGHIKNLLLHYFKIELSDFEISFNKYLDKLVNNFSNCRYTNYDNYGKHLIYKLLFDMDTDDKEFLDEGIKTVSFSLLNFNYTIYNAC